jgi:hypothetical protein
MAEEKVNKIYSTGMDRINRMGVLRGVRDAAMLFSMKGDDAHAALASYLDVL